jgi:ubiquinone/menaquinone biosynthesis C-methylase UbiE
VTDEVQDIFSDIHSGLPREGPGDNASTRRAFSLLPGLPAGSRILDVGCGPGMQTLELATLTDGDIYALDIRQEFLDTLSENARRQSTPAKITPVLGSMFEMPFEPMSFDLIWSEGAIFIIGFEKGLTAWRPFLREQGLMSVTHISWLKPSVPEEPKSFWQTAYPEITSVEENLATIEKCGYKNLGQFTLPEAAWWDDYYAPLKKRLGLFKEKYKDDPSALALIDGELSEIALYKEYSHYYGYVFYLMQKTARPE